MYCSKKISFIFTILFTRLLLLNAGYAQSYGGNGAVKYQDYIEGLLKLKGKMLSNAMKMLLKKEEDDAGDSTRDTGDDKKSFIDLGSHPIATPGTLHPEDFTMPPKQLFNEACKTTTEAEPEAATKPKQNHSSKHKSDGEDWDEDTKEAKHGSNWEDWCRKKMVHKMIEENKSRKEESNERGHDAEKGETAGQRHKHPKEKKTQEEESEEEETTTKTHDDNKEESVTERCRNETTTEKDDEEMVTKETHKEEEEPTTESRHKEPKHKSADKDREEEPSGSGKENEETAENRQKSSQKDKSKDKEQEEETTKADQDKNESASDRHKNPKEKGKGENENEEEETTKADKDKDESAGDQHNSLKDENKDKGNEEETKNSDKDKNENVDDRQKKPTDENKNEEETRKSDKLNEDHEETETKKPQIISCTCKTFAILIGHERKHDGYETNIERPHAESNETSTENSDEEMEECEEGEEPISEENARDTTTCGPDEEEVVEDHFPAPFRFTIIELTTANPYLREKGPNETGIHIPLQPTAGQPSKETEGHTTCGPDEEEVPEVHKVEETQKGATYQMQTQQQGTASEGSKMNATKEANGAVTGQPVSVASNDVSAPTLMPIDAYRTMCYPVTEPPASAVPEATTQSNQNASVSSSQDAPPALPTDAPSPATPTTAQAPNGEAQETTTTQFSQPMPQAQSSETQPQPPAQPEAATPPTASPADAQPPSNRTQEPSVTSSPAHNAPELTTQAISGYPTMCYPVTEPPSANTATVQPVQHVNTRKRRRYMKIRRKAPSMRATLHRVGRELRQRENKPVDKTKLLSLVHYAGQPHYQRYYFRGLRDSSNAVSHQKRYDYSPDEEDEPQLTRYGKDLNPFDYNGVKDEEQSEIFEDTMRVKLPHCPTKPPPPQSMSQKCAGKSHDLQHFLHEPPKKPLCTVPKNQCDPSEEEKMPEKPLPLIIPIPKIENDANGSCKEDTSDDFSLDTNCGAKDGKPMESPNGCDDFGIEQFKKKSQAQISLEAFRKAQEADPLQQKLSFMGRLLGRRGKVAKCGDASTKNATNPSTPVAEPEQKSKSINPLKTLFSWLSSKPSCDKCHQKTKIKDILHHKDSMNVFREATAKHKRQNGKAKSNGNHGNDYTEVTRKLRRRHGGPGLHKRHTNKRRKHARDSRSNKVRKAIRVRPFMEHVNPRRQSFQRQPRLSGLYEESNSRLNWHSDDIPDLSFNWDDDIVENIGNIF